MISPQVSNIAVMLLMMQASRRIDMENEQTILYIRIAYVVSIATSYLIYMLIKRKIVLANDETPVKIVSAKNPMKPQEPQTTEIISTKDYDLREVDSAMKSILSGMAMMAFMHLYMKYTNPLFMQTINPIKGALEHNEAKIHLFGNKAEGDLKRPFKTVGLLDGLMGNTAAAKKEETEDQIVEAASTSATTTGTSNRIEELN
ncbi:similar to Saccharomyces cerevisiae YBR106W PHO88 Probable membrane protein, involved in phosphate transport [Maudiozyma barnettii]|uniref:Similar to Saccharomyces cerevisiae YBR106W PHO88 Probable membrane protein, involved in phosphate transport n=1 Tax=Maudiozyma barnettii TaxID=61262 RepID=A0A8H2ZF43_9SACH|nr:Snd3p [Kazachstania barnettii]CAB4251935.1 similar to Saccharomyces cerevisiae YBR106W PHO88 Probable membrane protein, involved in phosphate transport [Kazachstania barnettii]CAD1778291.1 similar to Saccharomyces cerevisiae YBR106W PHO88 Probable membrane protein, involved in phosphate transport [Kazachstania barnettii]